MKPRNAHHPGKGSRRSRRGRILATTGVLAVFCSLMIMPGTSIMPRAAAAEAPHKPLPFDEDMTGYRSTPDSNAVTRLNGRLDTGSLKLSRDAQHGYLLSLLGQLKIPLSSQLLVASKTSLNKAKISPKNPRALYYNDEVSIAYVPSADIIEVASADPVLGVVFYTLDQKESSKPRLVRDDRCLECHVSSKTLDVPGLLVRSFLTKADGDVNMLSGLLVNHRTPISKRWGGYYVTGTHGDQVHRGNIFGAEAIARHKKDPTANGNVTDLRPLLNVSKYPEPGSDIVALMVLEHLAHMHNLITRFHADASAALHAGSSLKPAHPAAESLLRYMLFADEAQLNAPIAGTSDFARQFEDQGPKDPLGRSLRQFDLRTRLFKYPCSFLIYSPAFEALPSRARRYFYRRLAKILSGEDRSQTYESITLEQRHAIREILKATKSNLPTDWRL